MVKEKIKNLKGKVNYKIIYIVLCITFLITLLYLNQTHAYYNYESAWTPIFTSRVGNFAGDGENVKDGTIDKETDVNVIYYAGTPNSKNKYVVAEGVPVNNYKLNETLSNCNPKDSENGTTYPSHTISEDGTVNITVYEDKPNKIVCRLYYDYTNEKDLDVIVYAYIQDSNGTSKYNDNTYKIVNIVPINKTFEGYNCTNKEITTNITYDNSDININTNGPNICRVYFR